ncbi:MAG: hypothetical protein AAFP98_02980 [Pseudomonadota bacterium]
MRGAAHRLYALIYRAQALVGLVLVAWMISNVPNALVREQYVGVPLSVAVIALVVSLALLWPYLTPTWMAQPSRLRHVVSIVLAHATLPILYIFVGMSAIVAANVAAPLDNQLAIAIAAFFLTAGGFCFCVGTALCFWAEQEETPAHDNVSVLVPLKEAKAVAYDADVPEIDFQALREARVSRAS